MKKELIIDKAETTKGMTSDRNKNILEGYFVLIKGVRNRPLRIREVYSQKKDAAIRQEEKSLPLIVKDSHQAQVFV